MTITPSSQGRVKRISHVFLISVDEVDPFTLGICKDLFDVDPIVIKEFDFRGESADLLERYADPRAFVRRYGRYPTAGQVGCALSHRECWRRLVDEGGKAALIFEDDVQVDGSIREVVPLAMERIAEWDLLSLRLGNAVVRGSPFTIDAQLNAYQATVFCGGAFSYVIAANLAKQFLEAQKPKVRHYSDWPLEVWKFRLWSIDCDIISFTNRPSNLQHSAVSRPSGPNIDLLVYAMRKLMFRLYRSWRLRIMRDRLV